MVLGAAIAGVGLGCGGGGAGGDYLDLGHAAGGGNWPFTLQMRGCEFLPWLLGELLSGGLD